MSLKYNCLISFALQHAPAENHYYVTMCISSLTLRTRKAGTACFQPLVPTRPFHLQPKAQCSGPGPKFLCPTFRRNASFSAHHSYSSLALCRR